jgi:hypothetical protein
MREELVEQLMRDHPDLFKKADQSSMFQVRGLECEDGWYNIINTLCVVFESDLKAAEDRLKWAKGFGSPMLAVQEAEAAVAAAIEALPVLEIVKEKFGTMRVSARNLNPTTSSYIHFAEAMSACTCEGCGVPAVLKTGGWVKTMCDECHTKYFKKI